MRGAAPRTDRQTDHGICAGGHGQVEGALEFRRLSALRRMPLPGALQQLLHLLCVSLTKFHIVHN
jgi:hypothetical protein